MPRFQKYESYSPPPPPPPSPSPPPPPPTYYDPPPPPPTNTYYDPPPPPPTSTYYDPPPPYSWPPPVPSPPPDHHYKIVIGVCVSVGGVCFLAFLAAALFWFKKKRRAPPPPVEVVERIHIHEDIVPGPCGPEVVGIEVDKDIVRTEIVEGFAVSPKSSPGHAKGGGGY